MDDNSVPHPVDSQKLKIWSHDMNKTAKSRVWGANGRETQRNLVCIPATCNKNPARAKTRKDS